MSNKAAVVLCAGIGSRMGLPDNINKCATPINDTSPVRHSVVSLVDAGFFNIIVVLGHAQASVRETLRDIPNSVINFVVNNRYCFHGCNYSIACGVLALEDNIDQLLITEGDSLLHPDSTRLLSETPDIAASLLRSPDYIDLTRSVVAIGSNELIDRYYYDRQHNGTQPGLGLNERVLGDSMQLWLFKNDVLIRLKSLLREYKDKADNSEKPMLESGIYTINKLASPITPVFSGKPDDWINLNTYDDLRKAGNQSWLLK